ncbi:hypothetical protein PZ897_05970 [Hoeflea sp. YIM 152468]|uniref:hypothetical protein n=1 Tax=Hoeflea sp. YIM 152468 TaxID=3031759 RepID=UPI0023DBF5DC|nr:hypothetical protein [Hoeflea sp. YIM 152468]MDF1607718.1 hypothetical protein [Hoeflea sp. YIM 152468]
MSNWSRRHPTGEGLWHKAHANMVGPNLLRQATLSPNAGTDEKLPNRDPLAALGQVLITRAGDQVKRIVGPLPEPLASTAPDPGPASGVLGQDLAGALEWREQLVKRLRDRLF